MFKNLTLRVIFHISGRKILQNFFKNLYQVSLLGLNIGGGASPLNSGEKFALAYIKKKLYSIKNLVIFDVGANTGLYTQLVINIFYNHVLIYSFEPSHKTFLELQSNIGNKQNVNIFNFGFGSKNIKTILFRDIDASAQASIYKGKFDHFGTKLNKSERIVLKTIDSFCQTKKIKHIHLLKLDTEGNEMRILEGARRMIDAKAIDYIQFEFGVSNIDSRTFFQDFFYLLKDKYRIYRILKDGLHEIKKYSEVDEIFLTTNYLAELKIKPDKGRIGIRS